MATPKLTYRIAPTEAFPSSKATITITGTNDTGGVINFTQDDQVKITFPENLATDYGFSFSTPASSGFTMVKGNTPGLYLVNAAGFATTMQPGDKLTATFTQVPITDKTDNFSFSIEELIDGVNDKITKDFKVTAPGLNIIAWLDDLIVGQLQTTTLNWVSTGGSKVVVSHLPTPTGEENVALNGNMQVYVPLQAINGEWTFTVTVSSGNTSKSQNVVLEVKPAIINSFAADPNVSKINVDESLNLGWHTQFATSVILTTPTIPNEREHTAVAQYPVTPGNDLANAYKFSWAQLPATADYILTANGFQDPKNKTISIGFNPITLVYFKYRTSDKKIAESKVSAPGWLGVVNDIGDDNVQVLTIHQPGGTSLVYYLGAADTTHPQITVFNFTKNGNTYDLSWETSNCTGLTLDGTAVASGDIAKGSKTGVAAGTYTLLGTAANGDTVNSILVVGD